VVKKTEEKRSPGRPKKVVLVAKEKRVNIGVPIDEQLWRRIRALAVREGKLTGELLDQAIRDYLNKHE
jgi:hypothetical protein